MPGNTPTIPNSFTANTKAKSAEVNANFTAANNAITDGTTDIVIGTTFTKYSAKTADYIVTDTDAIHTVAAAAPSTSFTFVDADVSTANDTITETAHGLTDGMVVHFQSTAGVPTGLSAGTPYYVVSADANTFKVSATPGGSAVDITAAATAGTHTCYKGLVVTLPTAAANSGRILRIIKTDSNPNMVVIEGEGAETVAGSANKFLVSQHGYIALQCNATSWPILGVTRPASASHMRVETGGGVGSTNTKIRIFTVLVESTGTAITRATSAADGDSFTVNEAGVYSIHYSDLRDGDGAFAIGITKNSAELTTDILSVTNTTRLAVCNAQSASGTHSAFVSATVILAAGDVIRPHVGTGGGAVPNNAAIYSAFSITQVVRHL